MPATAPAITIVAGVDELARVRAFVRERVAAGGWDDEEAADFVQAVDELVCNVIAHGYTGRPGPVASTGRTGSAICSGPWSAPTRRRSSRRSMPRSPSSGPGRTHPMT